MYMSVHAKYLVILYSCNYIWCIIHTHTCSCQRQRQQHADLLSPWNLWLSLKEPVGLLQKLWENMQGLSIYPSQHLYVLVQCLKLEIVVNDFYRPAFFVRCCSLDCSYISNFSKNLDLSSTVTTTKSSKKATECWNFSVSTIMLKPISQLH